jgi:hypothetical protein
MIAKDELFQALDNGLEGIAMVPEDPEEDDTIESVEANIWFDDDEFGEFTLNLTANFSFDQEKQAFRPAWFYLHSTEYCTSIELTSSDLQITPGGDSRFSNIVMPTLLQWALEYMRSRHSLEHLLVCLDNKPQQFYPII